MKTKKEITCNIQGDTFKCFIITSQREAPRKAIYYTTLYAEGGAYNIYWSVGTDRFYAMFSK